MSGENRQLFEPTIPFPTIPVPDLLRSFTNLLHPRLSPARHVL